MRKSTVYVNPQISTASGNPQLANIHSLRISTACRNPPLPTCLQLLTVKYKAWSNKFIIKYLKSLIILIISCLFPDQPFTAGPVAARRVQGLVQGGRPQLQGQDRARSVRVPHQIGKTLFKTKHNKKYQKIDVNMKYFITG